jgi:hypothetical protein
VLRLVKVLALAVVLSFMTVAPVRAAARSSLHVHWMRGSAAPGTPARFNRVGVIEVGPRAARNVLVLEPGTSAGAGYFVPLAKWIAARLHGWQVWSVERRENLLEDQSVLQAAKLGQATATQMFDYYLGWLTPAGSTGPHIQLIPDARVRFAKGWGMRVAVEDLHAVIRAARHRGGHVVLGGHSLGGAIVTAYATWDFKGRPGGEDLAGLVYIDGGSLPAVSAAAARSELRALDSAQASPWLTFGGIPAPFAGLFSAAGSLGALIDPDSQSLGQSSGLLDAFHLTPAVPVSNLAQFGYALNVGTSPPALIAAQAHLGRGIAPRPGGGPDGWDGAGALTPITRFARMLSGFDVDGADGSEWYFPQRLTIDAGAVGNGIVNPAQSVLGVRATMGRRLPRRLEIYAFGARLGGAGVLLDARALATQSGIPAGHLLLINRAQSYAHNDPAGAFPRNAFAAGLFSFLTRVVP